MDLICTSLVNECQFQAGYSYFSMKIANRQLKKRKEDIHTSPMYTVLYAAAALLHLILIAF